MNADFTMVQGMELLMRSGGRTCFGERTLEHGTSGELSTSQTSVHAQTLGLWGRARLSTQGRRLDGILHAGMGSSYSSASRRAKNKALFERGAPRAVPTWPARGKGRFCIAVSWGGNVARRPHVFGYWSLGNVVGEGMACRRRWWRLCCYEYYSRDWD
ncbi:uncharacterized protein LY79DRAFT_99212 [Colletotrichum navitas]|uniref:Uncharacterized protein n=1 Tax=Colletotrichum navitas TaxID=681940 RepID=A0AAD8Q428_9PEZI|nr:uncharacterized protein LY79DRAFT_99212 [Colletotrichum navitas]KAK1595463.1 hypothetical protein LY79DRAFT_99212 [Colletotrichum navitas]